MTLETRMGGISGSTSRHSVLGGGGWDVGVEEGAAVGLQVGVFVFSKMVAVGGMVSVAGIVAVRVLSCGVAGGIPQPDSKTSKAQRLRILFFHIDRLLLWVGYMPLTVPTWMLAILWVG